MLWSPLQLPPQFIDTPPTYSRRRRGREGRTAAPGGHGLGHGPAAGLQLELGGDTEHGTIFPKWSPSEAWVLGCQKRLLSHSPGSAGSGGAASEEH